MNCPYCQAPLTVTEQPGGQPAVCPHCLSNIPGPHTASAGVAPNIVRDIRRRFDIRRIIRRDGDGGVWMGWTAVGTAIVIAVLGIGVIRYKDGPRATLWPCFLWLVPVVILASGMLIWRYYDIGEEPDSFAHVYSFVVLMIVLALVIVLVSVVVCAVIL
jgi:hypothetical protein